MLACPVLAFLGLNSAVAAPIEVNNHSFERPALGAGGWNNNLPDPDASAGDPDWLGRDGANSGSAFIEFIGGFFSEGNQHVGMAGGYFLFQNLGIPYEANTEYKLTVGVGFRNNGQSGAEATSIFGLTVLDEPPGDDNFLEGADSDDQLEIDDLLKSNAVVVDSVELNGAQMHTFTDQTAVLVTGAEPPQGNIVIFIGDQADGGRSQL